MKERRSFSITGGMCPRCEGRGTVSDIDLAELYDDGKSLNEGALTIPGYTPGGWGYRLYSESGFFDPDKPIRKFTKKELHDFLYHEPVRMKIGGINQTYEGLILRMQQSMLSKDREAMQPHIRAFVDRAVTFTTCPDCDGTRLSEARPVLARSAGSTSPTPARCRSATWPSGSRPRRAVGGAAARHAAQTLDSFAEIGLGYLSLDRPSGTLSGGEAQRVKMIRHLGSSLTDVTYVFDEPTIGLHPHDIQRMNELLLRLRDKGNTVLVVEHKPETIAIADHVVDLGPGAGAAGGSRLLRGHRRGAAGQRHRHRPPPRRPGRAQGRRCARRPGVLEVRGATHAQPAGRRRRHPARRAGRRHRGGRLGQELADPRLDPGRRRRRVGRPGRRSAARGAATRRPTPGCSTRSAPRSRRPTA